jgi:hypothetical protein
LPDDGHLFQEPIGTDQTINKIQKKKRKDGKNEN